MFDTELLVEASITCKLPHIKRNPSPSIVHANSRDMHIDVFGVVYVSRVWFEYSAKLLCMAETPYTRQEIHAVTAQGR